jgi:geranylgeranyl reductase family protein
VNQSYPSPNDSCGISDPIELSKNSAATFRADLPDVCDVLVIGAGPAGLLAAQTLGAGKAGRIVLLDRRDPWREPVACAEAVRRPCLEKVSPLPIEPWIRSGIDHLCLATETSSFRWTRRGDGLIIDRAKMHADLAHSAAGAGVLCHFRARALSVGALVDGWRTVDIEIDGRPTTVKARAVIDASGPGKGVGRAEDLADGTVDLEAAVFAIVEGIPVESDTITLWYSKRFAPGGYAWSFPSSEGKANVGVVCGRGRKVSARQGLAMFLEHLQPGLVASQVHGGAIPCGSGSGTLACDMLFKAGDAASMVHPLSRAGILEAMESGAMAARAVMKALGTESDTERSRVYREYAKEWMRGRGRAYRLAQWIKPILGAVPDASWSRLFDALDRAPTTHRLHHQVILTALRTLPSAILAGLRR